MVFIRAKCRFSSPKLFVFFDLKKKIEKFFFQNFCWLKMAQNVSEKIWRTETRETREDRDIGEFIGPNPPGGRRTKK